MKTATAWVVTCLAMAWGVAALRGGEVPKTQASFDAAQIKMKIEDFKVDAAKVGAQCTGSFVVVNTGPGYDYDSGQVMPYWMLTIADGKGKQVHMAGGAWGGAMKTGDKRPLTFDTHSNALAGAGGKPFVFPEVGKYVATMTLYPGGDVHKGVDVKEVTVDVAKPK